MSCGQYRYRDKDLVGCAAALLSVWVSCRLGCEKPAAGWNNRKFYIYNKRSWYNARLVLFFVSTSFILFLKSREQRWHRQSLQVTWIKRFTKDFPWFVMLGSLGILWFLLLTPLTHWGRVMHICVSKLTIIGSDNGLSRGRRQAIIWTSAGILLIGSLGTNISEILIRIQTFSFKKMLLKMSSAKWRPFCLGLNVLTTGNAWVRNQQWLLQPWCYSTRASVSIVLTKHLLYWTSFIQNHYICTKPK